MFFFFCSINVYPIINSYTKPLNIFPIKADKISRTINIRSSIGNNNITKYYAKFSIIGDDCIDPTITIYVEDTDFNEIQQNINVYYEQNLIAQCYSQNQGCGTYQYCINQYALSNVSRQDSQIVILLERSKKSQASSVCNLTLYADVTITCGRCQDYSSQYRSNNGQNEYQPSDEIFDINHHLATMIRTQQFTANLTNSYLQRDIQCKTTDCKIDCIEYASCLSSNITLLYSNLTKAENQAIVQCHEKLSCFKANFQTVSETRNTELLIICNNTESCREMAIDISNFKSFTVLCLQTESCQDMHIDLTIPTLQNKSNIQIEINDTYNHGIIHCVVPNACKDLVITTNSNHTRLIMYEHSEGVIFDNGIGYLSDLSNIICNNDRFIEWSAEISSLQEIAESILEEYESGEYPCNGVEVICNASSCNMEYDINVPKLQEIEREATAVCYWVNVQEIQNVYCDGGCVASPTSNPTQSPTQYPTSPSESPTEDPTSQPTFDPSENPSVAPSAAPSLSPTVPPTRAPTISDAYDYYIEIVYNIRGLTADDIDLMTGDILNVTNDIRIIIEQAYVMHPAGITWQLNYNDFYVKVNKVNGDNLRDIANNNRLLDVSLSEGIELESIIECTLFICNFIIERYNQTGFENLVSNKLQTYFDYATSSIVNTASDEGIIFNVESMAESAQLINPPASEPRQYVFIALIIITSIIAFIAILALLWNKISPRKPKLGEIPAMSIVDNARWTSVIRFALQFWDFASDVNLAVEIWNRNDVWTNTFMLVIASGSSFFIILPYIANLIIASRIKEIIKKNEAAKAWFVLSSLFTFHF